MGNQDRHIDTLRKRIFISALDMQGIGDAGVGTNVLQSLSGASALYQELSTFGFGAVLMPSGVNLAGYYPCPIDLDPKWPVGFRIQWTGDQTAGGAAAFSLALEQDVFKKGTALSVPSGALNSVIGSQVYADTTGASPAADTPFLLQTTNRGIRTAAALGLTRDDIEAGAMLGFLIGGNTYINLTSVWFIGILMDYVRHECIGPGSLTDRPLNAHGRN